VDVRSDRTHSFSSPPEHVWTALGRVDSYRRWWPWLRAFDAHGLVAGDRWDCTVRPPLPYALHFTVELHEVDEPRRIRATVSGDIRGTALVELTPTPDGCDVRLASILAPTGRPLRAVTRFTPWLARFGHDWVLNTGLGQFRRRAL